MSKFSLIARLQHWMDSVPGQTFMNYAYSWGAAVVILGTLFKLTHIPGANAMLFIGMGTEVFVFFISGFDRPFDAKVDTELADDFVSLDELEAAKAAAEAAAAVATANVQGGGAPVIIGGGIPAGGTIPAGASVDAADIPAAAHTGGGGTVVIGGGGGGAIIAGGGGGTIVAGGSGSGGGTIVTGGGGGGGISDDAAANLAAAAAAVAAINPQAGIGADEQTLLTNAQAANAPEVEDAIAAYVDQLTELTDVLGKVKEQASRMSTDSAEMENLNRTLTGINTIYEMQLKSISQQVGTIDNINEQTRKMASQIEELNAIYARMIEAMTTNMPGARA